MIALHHTTTKSRDPKGRIYGVDIAVRDWIKAWLQFGSEVKFNFLIGERAEWEEVQELAADANVDPSRLIGLDRRYVRENMAQFDTVLRLNPDSRNLLWQREQLAGPLFGFCGLAHAISGVEAGKLLEQYCLAPSNEFDAIVCPSKAVQASIRAFWDQYGAYIGNRFGKPFHCPVQLPIIPLGINIEQFEQKATLEKRATQRALLSLDDDDCVVLWVGRLSSAIKAHPLAMFQSVERAATKTGKPVHFIMVGYFMPEEARAQFEKLAADICQDAKVTFIASDDQRFPDGLWAAGDIFLSLIDNMQESFGLTPIEAMAAGLPRVLSDWDGYRDSVEHGADGFLIPTTQPPPGSGGELSRLLLNEREMYGGFLAKTALSVSSDQIAAGDALALLIDSPFLRKEIAAKARDRARKTYGWKRVIGLYEELWRETAEQRKHAAPLRQEWPSYLPQAPDPFKMYEAYPSSILRPEDSVRIDCTPDMMRRLWSHEINVLALDIMITPENVTRILNYIGNDTSKTIGSVLDTFSDIDPPSLWRAIGWLIKLGILRRERA